MGQPGKRPRLLFLACYFPPVQVIASVRTGNIARYLARLGWEVTVVTPDPSVWRNLEDCEKVSMELEAEGINRILTPHRWRCLVPDHLNCWNQNLGWFAGGVCRTIARHIGIDRQVGWFKAAEQACSNLSPNDVDVILASGSPFGAFRVAKKLSDRLDRPYVLDYRDPWTGNPHIDQPPRPAIIREEANLVQGCAAVTIVSPSWGENLDRCYGIGAKRHIITNGYDANELASVTPYDFGHCAMVYTGNFYPPKRIISPFLAALKCLRESQNETSHEWYFHYYGAQESHIRKQAAQYGLSDRIVFHGRVARDEVLSAVKGASLAVALVSIEEKASPEISGMVPAKIFEAIGLGTPVLLIAPLGSDATRVTAPTGLVKSFTATDTYGMASFLKAVIRGEVPKSENIDAFSWQTIGGNLDVVLRSVMSSHSHATPSVAARQKCEARK